MATKKAQEQKEGKYIIDRASGRIISAGPEEVQATQPLLDILISEAGWSVDQIISRPQWRVSPSPSEARKWPVDIAIFDAAANCGNPEHVRILCECKRPDVQTGTEQLKIYLGREPHARVGIWFNGVDYAVIYKTNDGYETAPNGTPIPTPQDALVPIGRKILTLSDLRQAPSLIPVFKRIRDRLATLDRNINRDEEILPDISLLLLLKILDEQKNRIYPQRPLRFQTSESPDQTAQHIRDFLGEEVARNAQLFGANGRDIRFQVDDDSIDYVVATLQNYRLLANDTDAVADAFQVIRGKAYKGEEGQYFTPQSVVRVAIAAVNPLPDDRIIDPACGSGSFLATALTNVVDYLNSMAGLSQSEIDNARQEWCSHQLFALDKDSVSIRLSKAYLSMLGDGSAHVYKADSIRPKQWSSSLASTIQNGSFDVIVTNPPFGTKLKVPADIGRDEGYALSQEWKRIGDSWAVTGKYVKRDMGLIFLERSMQLLRPGGRLAIVLPDTYLFSDSYGWLVNWLSQFTITHSINVPIEAFEPYCRAKTSILVLKKAPPPKGHSIIGSVCETFGEDKHGRPRFTFDGSKQTQIRDDEMQEAARLLRSQNPDTSKLSFRFNQGEAIARGVLVASYWWRDTYLKSLTEFARANDCELVSVGDLIDSGDLEVLEGHGSPDSRLRGRGRVPYVKVVHIQNWRVIESAKYMISAEDADKIRRKRFLQPYDLITPTRASKNIGLFGVIMPWQKNVILTRENFIWRVPSKAERIDPWLLLAVTSLKVVHDQFNFLVLMQMNREDLGVRFRELLLPLPHDKNRREQWSGPIRDYFQATALAREKYDLLDQQLDSALFVDKP